MARKKALTVRIPEARLRKLMWTRKAKTKSDLINTLLAEERLHSHQVLRVTSGTLYLPRSIPLWTIPHDQAKGEGTGIWASRRR